jgi:hypothetical protein
MSITHKILDIKVLDRQKDGGRIVISTGNKDRDRDRVFPQGGKLANYLNNPVVLWGHDYFSAASLIGRATAIEVSEIGITSTFELRPAASETDPQHIVLLLWNQDFVRTASIGFIPETLAPNDFGGLDFVSWELLEWSLVPVPANADALRLAAEAYPKAFKEYQKRGRVLSAANEKKLAAARDALDEVLASVAEADDDKSVAVLRTQVRGLEAKIDQLLAQRLALPAPAPAPTPGDDPDDAALLARLNDIHALTVRREAA